MQSIVFGFCASHRRTQLTTAVTNIHHQRASSCSYREVHTTGRILPRLSLSADWKNACELSWKENAMDPSPKKTRVFPRWLQVKTNACSERVTCSCLLIVHVFGVKATVVLLVCYSTFQYFVVPYSLQQVRCTHGIIHLQVKVQNDKFGETHAFTYIYVRMSTAHVQNTCARTSCRVMRYHSSHAVQQLYGSHINFAAVFAWRGL